MVERASAQLCLWEGRRGTGMGRIERDNGPPPRLMEEHLTLSSLTLCLQVHVKI